MKEGGDDEISPLTGHAGSPLHFGCTSSVSCCDSGSFFRMLEDWVTSCFTVSLEVLKIPKVQHPLHLTPSAEVTCVQFREQFPVLVSCLLMACCSSSPLLISVLVPQHFPSRSNARAGKASVMYFLHIVRERLGWHGSPSLGTLAGSTPCSGFKSQLVFPLCYPGDISVAQID